MPNAKRFISSAANTSVVYASFKRLTDGFYLDDADGVFKAFGSITDFYVGLTEDATIYQLFRLSESRTVWDNGYYAYQIYRQLGGAPAPTTDTILDYGEIAILDDLNVDRNYLATKIGAVKTVVDAISSSLSTVSTNVSTALANTVLALTDTAGLLTDADNIIASLSIPAWKTSSGEAIDSVALIRFVKLIYKDVTDLGQAVSIVDELVKEMKERSK